MSRALLVGGLFFVASTAACSAVLGFDTFSLDPATTPGSEGGADSPTGPIDSGIVTCESSNKQTSALHCGRCDHNCLGGDCIMGQCQKVRVGDGLSQPEGLTVTDDFIFVAEFSAGRILKYDRVVKGVCSGSPCVHVDNGNGADHPTGMGSDKTNVYWASYSSETNAPGIHACAISGCTAPTVLTHFAEDVLYNHGTPDDVLPLQLIVQGGQVFWSQNTDGAIQSVTTDGATVNTWLAPNPDYSPVDIAVNETNIFFTVNGTGVRSAEIFALPLTPSATPVQVANAPAPTYGVSLAPSGDLYWTMDAIDEEDFRDGAVQSAPSAQRSATAQGLGFSPSQAGARMIQTDATNVYWINGGLRDLVSKKFDEKNGAIVYCAATGCPADGPIQLAGGENIPRHLTQDAEALYWTNEGHTGVDGEVWKIAKP